jgi:hypothetical protein
LESFGYLKILNDFFLPFTENFPCGYRLVQDNDPKHTSYSTKNFMRIRGINLLETPVESPVRTI